MDEFRLQFCEWRGSGVDPSPQTFVVADLGNGERRYALKVRADRVFFRETDAPKAPVLALTAPADASLTEEDEALQKFFSAEVEAGRWGRFAPTRRGFTLESGQSLHTTLILVIIGTDGCNIAREWCGGEWLPFEMSPAPASNTGAMIPPMWSAAWKPLRLRPSLNSLAQSLSTRQFQPTTKPHAEGWIQGNEAKLRELLEAVLKFCPTRGNSYFTPHVYYWLDSPITPAHIELWPRISGSELLLATISREFVVGGYGGHWRGRGEQRLGWFFRHSQIRVPKDPGSAPTDVTAHEKLEALITLRDWLRERKPEPEVERLLAFARRSFESS